MPIEVVGTGMIARAFAAISADGPSAIVCASGVADSRSADPVAFRREVEMLRELADRAIAKDSVLVYFSGAPVYGHAEGRHVESSHAVPESPYGLHKLQCEAVIAASRAKYLVLRLPNVVGPGGNRHQLIPSLVAQVASGQVLLWSGATRDLLDVDDLVRIVGALLDRGAVDSIINVASGVSTPVARLAEEISAILDVSPAITIVEGGDRQEFSIAAARTILTDYPRFDAAYPMTVLRRHVPSIHRVLEQQTPTEPAEPRRSRS